jgi:hypothetical protein
MRGSPTPTGLVDKLIGGVDYTARGQTLCGLAVTRLVTVFTPDEATCRECRKRWQLEVAPEVRAATEVRPYVRGEALPVPAPEVIALVRAGLTLQAINSYRQMNPGIGLRQATKVITGL